MSWLVGDHFLKSPFSVIITWAISLEEFEGHVRNNITMVQYRYSLLAVWLSFLMGTFVVFKIIL
jgi:hypothetical protein